MLDQASDYIEPTLPEAGTPNINSGLGQDALRRVGTSSRENFQVARPEAVAFHFEFLTACCRLLSRSFDSSNKERMREASV